MKIDETLQVPSRTGVSPGPESGAAPSAGGQPSRAAYVLAFASIYWFWGSTYLAMRVAVFTIPPFLMTGSRFLMVGCLLFLFLRLRGARWPTMRQWRISAVTGAGLLLCGNGVVVWSTQFVPSGITALLVGVTPLFIILAEWAWPGGSRPTGVVLFALLLGFAGVVWLAAPWEGPGRGGVDPAGVAAILLACAALSVAAIYSRHAQIGVDARLAAAMQMLTGGTMLILLAAVQGELARFEWNAVPPRAWAAYAYLTLGGSLAGFSSFVWLMKHSTPARASTYAYVNPVIAVLLGWLVADEPITGRTLVAAVIIIVAVVIITSRKNRSMPAR
jgi:drug/metabolite transporter (DMT)-like permease